MRWESECMSLFKLCGVQWELTLIITQQWLVECNSSNRITLLSGACIIVLQACHGIWVALFYVAGLSLYLSDIILCCRHIKVSEWYYSVLQAYQGIWMALFSVAGLSGYLSDIILCCRLVIVSEWHYSMLQAYQSIWMVLFCVAGLSGYLSDIILCCRHI